MESWEGRSDSADGGGDGIRRFYGGRLHEVDAAVFFFGKEDEMLVLGRFKGQSVVIAPSAEPIKIEVCYIRGSKVGIGIDAPEDVTIVRSELLEKDMDE